MKKQYLILIVIVAISAHLAAPALAQVGQCSTGQAQSFISSNNVRATIQNDGGLFVRGSALGYEVPKGSGLNSLFRMSLWMGGFVGSTLRVSAAGYGPYELWPGPVATATSNDGCGEFDRIYRIAKRDLEALDTGNPPGQDVFDWPWQLGAPVIDDDGNPNNYDLAAGDRPEILGEESAFMIMNDVGNLHPSTGSAPLGVEVHLTAFSAGSTNPDIDNATFYRYRIYNRNALPIDMMRIGFFLDTDIGNHLDDYVGSDPALNLAYAYNSDNDDDADNGYGSPPPAVGVQVLGGSDVGADGIDNDGDDVIDEAGEQLAMTSVIAFTEFVHEQNLPSFGAEYYNYLQGLWRDGVPVLDRGTGRFWGGSETRFMYDGTPPGFWSELNVDSSGTENPLFDRRFVVGIGPMNLEPGEYKEVFVAVLWAQGADNLDSVVELRAMAARLAASVGLPEDVVGTTLSAVVETPEPTVPSDGSTGQPVDVTLEWIFGSGPDFEFEVQVADNDGFANATSLFATSTQLNLGGVVEEDQEYVWRVRAFNAASYSPWSSVFTFSTGDIFFGGASPFESFTVVANAAGPVDPPDMGAFAFNQSGFPLVPCRFDPGSLCDRPSSEQQSTTDARWGIHAGNAGLPYSEFLARVLRNGINDPTPYDYEIRFTGTSLHYDRFGLLTGGIIAADPLPFEVWNIGIDTPIDTDDDFRMIVAALDWEADGWGLRNVDHPISAAENDPQTDWFYLHEPTNTEHGPAGYEAWALGAGTDPEVGLGPEVLARLVLVNWNGGFVFDVPPVYNALLPEPGTIFRISTLQLAAPVLASPGDDGFTPPGNVPFFWSSSSFGPDILVVATDPGLSSVVATVGDALPGAVVDLPLVGTYYWQIQGFGNALSDIFSFTVANTAQYDFDVVADWNLVGTPFTAFDMSTETVFGLGVAKSVTTFAGRYVRPPLDVIRHGTGYWVQYPGPESVSNNGFIRSAFDVELEPGWNLIAGPACTMNASAATGDTGIIEPGTLSGYALGVYDPVSVLVGGNGYWIRTNAAGQITLDCAAPKGNRQWASGLDLLETYDSFRLTPDGEGGQTMYFGGVRPEGVSDNAFSLPPYAPNQTWRAEYTDGRYITEQQTALIDLTGSPLPIILQPGSVEPGDGLEVVLKDDSGAVLERSILADGEGFEINHSGVRSLEITMLSNVTTATESNDLPERFELEPNYPNPFNPTTTIRFALPKPDNVSIMIMDVTGRTVAMPMVNATLNAGWHDVTFNAGRLASGVYFYRVATREESKTRSMVLLR